MQRIRVLHAPEAMGGHAPQLARAEREIGLDSWCVSFRENPFGYPCDEVLWDDPRRVTGNELKRWRLLWRALREYDVVHFNFGSPILPKRVDRRARPKSHAQGFARTLYNVYAGLVEFRDLKWLRRAGKAVFVTYQGDDARQGDFCRRHFRVSPVDEVDPDYYSPEGDERKRHEIATFERFAHGMFSLNLDLLHVLPQRTRYLPYANVDPREWRPPDGRRDVERPRLLHAPSHRGVKGTRFVVEAVRRLKDEGVPFDFTLIEGLSIGQARTLYERADLVVDQLLLGGYGGLAVELMALGKPVVCYMREDDLKFMPPQMRADLPVINAEPNAIYDVLKMWLTSRKHELPERGAKSRAFVETWHHPVTIAAQLKEEYVLALNSIRSSPK